MSDRLEELRATFVIEGIDECLQLVQKFEKTDPEAAKNLVNDALGSLPEQDVNHGPLVGFAISVIRGAYGAFMGRSNAEPDVVNAVSRITASVEQRLESGWSTLPDPAPKVLSDRLEELHMAFLRKNQQIPGVEECLELLRELETKDPTAAQTLLDDAFSSGSTPDNSIASTAMSLAHGAFGAVMGRSSARPATFPLQKEPEIDYTEAMLVVKFITADVKHRLLELEPRLSDDAVASSDGGSQGAHSTKDLSSEATAGHLQQEMEQMGMVLAFAYQKGLEIKAISPADFGDSWSPADVAGPSRTDQPLPGLGQINIIMDFLALANEQGLRLVPEQSPGQMQAILAFAQKRNLQTISQPSPADFGDSIGSHVDVQGNEIKVIKEFLTFMNSHDRWLGPHQLPAEGPELSKGSSVVEDKPRAGVSSSEESQGTGQKDQLPPGQVQLLMENMPLIMAFAQKHNLQILPQASATDFGDSICSHFQEAAGPGCNDNPSLGNEIKAIKDFLAFANEQGSKLVPEQSSGDDQLTGQLPAQVEQIRAVLSFAQKRGLLTASAPSADFADSIFSQFQEAAGPGCNDNPSLGNEIKAIKDFLAFSNEQGFWLVKE